MTTVTISLEQMSDSTPPTLHLTSEPTAYAGGGGLCPAPLFVPRDQAYYWSTAWQRDESEALREIAEGDVRSFESGASAAQWLLADDE